MDPRTLGRAVALGRVAIGAALIALPSRAAGGWIGAASESDATKVVIAGLGARDLILGAGTAWALGGSTPARPWLVASAVADSADLVATLRYRGALPPAGVYGVGALAAGAAAVGFWLASAVD